MSMLNHLLYTKNNYSKEDSLMIDKAGRSVVTNYRTRMRIVTLNVCNQLHRSEWKNVTMPFRTTF